MLVKVIDDVITLDSQKIMREIQREKNIEEDEPDMHSVLGFLN